jgi:hypothetical protein
VGLGECLDVLDVLHKAVGTEGEVKGPDAVGVPISQAALAHLTLIQGHAGLKPSVPGQDRLRLGHMTTVVHKLETLQHKQAKPFAQEIGCMLRVQLYMPL